MKSFFNRPRAKPAVKVQCRPCLIIGTTCPGATEWLLTHNRTRGFIVDVKVPGTVPEPVYGQFYSKTILCQHSTSECIRRGTINKPEGFFILVFIVNIYR